MWGMSRPSGGPRPLGAPEEWGEKAERMRGPQRPKGSQVVEENVSVFGAIRGSLDVGGAAKAIRQSMDGTRRSQDQRETMSKEASLAQRMSVEIARMSNDIQRRSVSTAEILILDPTSHCPTLRLWQGQLLRARADDYSVPVLLLLGET